MLRFPRRMWETIASLWQSITTASLWSELGAEAEGKAGTSYASESFLRLFRARVFTSDARNKRWSRRRDSNPRPAVYETAALPLSYVGYWTHIENIVLGKDAGQLSGSNPPLAY